MSGYFQLLLLVLVVIAGDRLHALDCTEATVDRADSPRFFQMMRECEDSARAAPAADANAAEPRSEVADPQKNASAGNTADPSRSPVTGKDAADKSGPALNELPTLHRSREHFSLDNAEDGSGGADVYSALVRKMARQCPRGWEKFREWVEKSAEGYIMNVEFGCL